MKNWITLEDGGSGRWLYAKPLDSKIPAAAAVWAFICIDDMVECCGRDADNYFCADVAVVSQLDIPVKTVEEAIRSCDSFASIQSATPEKRSLMIAQCCFNYGAKAPLWSGVSPPINKDSNVDWQWDVPEDSSPTFRRLRAAAQHFVEENLLSPEKRDKLMDSHVVNALGQTARAYSKGSDGLWDALRKIKEDIKEDPDKATAQQRLILSIYQKASEQTLGAGPIPPDIRSEDT